MSSPDWNDDDVLMAELSGAVTEADADRLVIAAAQGVFAWRAAFTELELELLTLTSDSLLDTTPAVRDLAGSEGPRILTFEARAGDDEGVELEVGERGIVGQLLPPGPGRVELLSAAGSLGAVTADEVGCFAFAPGDHAGAGPVRVRVETNGRRFVTDWVTLRR
jgi:hypothetical protein